MSKISKSLREVVEETNKGFKDSVASLASDGLSGDVPGWISSGVFMLDLALRGGIPLGRVIELYGRPSVGKSTLCTTIMIQFQKQNGIVIVIDSEGAWTRDRASSLGLNTDTLLELKANTVEDGFDHIESTIKNIRTKADLKECPVLIVWDTIAHAITRSQLESEKNSKDKVDLWKDGMIDIKPKRIGQGLKRLAIAMKDNKITIMFVNQIIEGRFGETTPGGWAVKFAASQRIRLSKSSTMTSNKGIITKAQIVKNKVGRWPSTIDNEIEFPILDEVGIDSDKATFDYLVELRVNEVKTGAGGWYTIQYKGNDIRFQGRDLQKIITDNPGFREWMQEIVISKFQQKSVLNNKPEIIVPEKKVASS